jgi:putative tricarboxylic transport membrane protein
VIVEALIGGLIQVFTWPNFGLMLIGILVGFWVGILPGIGGATTLALMLPFIYDMGAVGAFAFLLGMISVTATTGDITSVLFAVPGEGTAAATILDGHPMAKKGEAGRALGAVLMSSLVGSVFGALVLAISIPIVRPLVLSFGSPELFMLTILAISFIGSLGGKSVLKGMIMGGFGFLLSMIGMEAQSAQMRYTFGLTYLWDGLSIVPVVVGLFGIPEIIDLAVKRSSIAEAGLSNVSGVMQGVRDTFRYWALTLRCSLIGAFFGILPGIGSGVGQWVVYAHAVQSSPDKDRFGKGAIEGVLGPGAANNSSMAAALIPTLAFGIPGGTAMAVLLGAFHITGLVPGPEMLTKHLTVTFSMFWVIVVANIITVAVSLLFVNQIAKITFVKSTILIPFILLLIYLGGFTAHNNFGDLVVVVVFGLLGTLMVWLDWPRPPLILGLVLGAWAEGYLYISTIRYGVVWLLRPSVVVILIITLAAIFYPLWTRYKQRMQKNRIME